MNKGLLFLFAALLISCDDSLEGVLNLAQKITFNTKYNGAVTMDVGKHKVKVSHNEKSHYLKLEFPRETNSTFPGDDNNWRDKSYEVRFKYAEETQIPTDNGSFYISRQESGQEVDLEGDIKTIIEKGELKKGTEYCETRERRVDCFPHGGGGVSCRDTWETIPGRKQVEFYPVQIIKTIDVSLKDLNGTSAASMNLNDIREERDYVYQGYCRRY